MITLTTDKLTVEENEPVRLSVSTDSPYSRVLIRQRIAFLPDAVLLEGDTDGAGKVDFIISFSLANLPLTSPPEERIIYATLTKRLWFDEDSNTVNILVYPAGALGKPYSSMPGEPVARTPSPSPPPPPVVPSPVKTIAIALLIFAVAALIFAYKR